VAQHKSAIKRIRRNDRANVSNSQYLGAVKTAVKKFRLAVASAQEGNGDKTALAPLFVTAQSMLAKAATKGVLHRNNAMRKIGRLSKLLKGIESGTTKAAAPTKTVKKAPAKKAAPAKKTPSKTATKAPAKKKK
jgi:small subunit ribosomal protein S20